MNPIEVKEQVERRVQSLRSLDHNDRPEVELVYLLQDMKAVVQSALPQIFYEDLIFDYSDDTGQKISPVLAISHMRIFVVDLGDGVDKDCCYFFSETRYSKNSEFVTRDRSAITSSGPCCWSQEGEPIQIKDIEENGVIVGVRTRFRLFQEPASTGRHFLHDIGSSKVYEFTLDEFASATDDQEEKRMMSIDQTPPSFVCLYKLIAHIVVSPRIGSERGTSSSSFYREDQLLDQSAAQSHLGGRNYGSDPADSYVHKSAVEMPAEVESDQEPVLAGVVHDSTTGSTEANEIEAAASLLDQHTQLKESYSLEDQDHNSPVSEPNNQQ